MDFKGKKGRDSKYIVMMGFSKLIVRDVLIMLLGVSIYALKTVQLCSNYATNFAFYASVML